MTEHAKATGDIADQPQALALGAAQSLGRLSAGLMRFGFRFGAGLIGMHPGTDAKVAPAQRGRPTPPLGRIAAGVGSVALAVLESNGDGGVASDDQGKAAVAIGRDQHTVWPDVPYIPLDDEPAAF